eukprot:135444_1
MSQKSKVTAAVATARIKKLCNITHTAVKMNVNNSRKIVEDGFKIYHQVGNDAKDQYLMNALIKLCVNHQQPERLWSIWDDIAYSLDIAHTNNVSISYTALLKCCIQCNDINKGKQIHSKIPSNLLQNDLLLPTVLIDFYGHFKDIKTATHIFESVSMQKDCVIINAMMKVLVDNQYYDDALSVYQQYHALVQSNDRSHVLAIKSCIHLNDYTTAESIVHGIHQEVHSVELMNTLIHFYGTCHKMNEAWALFNAIHQKTAVTINCMMQALMHNDGYTDAVSLYDTWTTLRNDRTHVLAIKSCIHLEENGLHKGKEIHPHIIDLTKRNTFIATAWIDFYGHFGEMQSAFHVFQNIKQKNAICCNSIMKTCITNGLCNDALSIYDTFDTLRNDTTHLLAIQACIHTNEMHKGKQIIEQSMNKKHSVELRNCVISFYGHFKDIDKALQVFKQMNDDDVKQCSTINNMMQVLLHNGYETRALELYHNYRNTLTNNISHILAIQACTNINNSRGYQYGKEIHEQLALLEQMNDIKIKTTLIGFYGHFNNIQSAEIIFHGIDKSQRNKAIANCMMQNYIENEYNDKALRLYRESARDCNVDGISHSLALKACCNMKRFEEGNRIIADINKAQTLSIELMNTLIHFHGSSGDVNAAINVFNMIPSGQMDIVSVNVMMGAYYDNKQYSECIQLFQRFNQWKEAMQPTAITYILLFKACAQNASLQVGQETHNKLKQSAKHEILQNASVQINLIQMYGKCGMIEVCEEIFNEIKASEYEKYCTNTDIWNAMMNAYGQNGNMERVKEMCENIKCNEDMVMNSTTYSNIIHLYSHNGAIDEAYSIWQHIADINIKYDLFVVSALVDGLARNEQLHEAHHIVQEYEKKNGIVIDANNGLWMSLLNGCKLHRNEPLACTVFDQMTSRFGHNQRNHDYIQSASILLQSTRSTS